MRIIHARSVFFVGNVDFLISTLRAVFNRVTYWVSPRWWLNGAGQMLVEHEMVYVDGSGAEGVYTVYGHRFGASACPESVTVRCLTVREHGYTARREKGMIATARKQIEKRLAAAIAECPAHRRAVA